MKKNLYLFTILVFIHVVAFAQSNTKQAKYWRYRQKLVSRMLRYGILDVPDYDPNRNNSPLNYPIGGYSLPSDEVNSSGGVEIWFGDTPQQLGMYMGVLATEYRLLKNNNQDYSMTLRELLRALQAFDRIDKWCEAKQQINGSGLGSPDLNGIALRDDVTLGFGKTHFYLKNNVQFRSGYKQNEDGNQDGKNFISKDHYAYLLVGWALVVRCVEDYETVDGQNIVNLAKDQVGRSIGKFSRDGFIMRHPSHERIPSGNMEVLSLGYADAGARTMQGYWDKNLKMDYRARFSNRTTFLTGNAWRQTASLLIDGLPLAGRSLGINLLINNIRDLFNDNVHNTSLPPNQFTLAYIDFVAAVASNYAFGLEPVVAFRMPFICMNNRWRIRFCQREWYIYRFSPPTTLLPAISLLSFAHLGIPMIPMPFRLPNLMLNYTGQTLSLKASISRTYLQPLVHQYLFDASNLFLTRESYRIMLDNAPEYGNFFRANKYFTGDGVEGWRVNNRFEKPISSINGESAFTGEYNGLDYMLLYNLYHLVNGENDGLGAYQAAFKPFYDKSWPQGQHNVNAESGIYFAGENNKIMAWANVKCKAPVVNLTEYFYTEPFSTFYVDADRNGTFGGGQRMASDSVPAYQPDPATLPIDTAALIEAYNTDFTNELASLINDSLGAIQAVNNQANTYAYQPICEYVDQNQDYIDFTVKEKVNLFTDELTLFPNPATAQLNMAFTLANSGYAKVSVISTSGTEVINATYPNLSAGLQQLSLDIAALNTGMYYIQVITSEKVYNGKISKI